MKRQRARKAVVWTGTLLVSLPILYVVAALGLSLIPVNGDFVEPEAGIDVFLISNGIHVDFLVPVETPVRDWSLELPRSDFRGVGEGWTHILFGWGDRGFYLETPTWADFELSTALEAVIPPGASVVHVQYMEGPPLEDASCRRLRLSEDAYLKLCAFLEASFTKDEHGNPILLPGKGYGEADNFYEGRGSYHAFNTCNLWTNRGLKATGAPAPLWSPFARGVLRHLPLRGRE